jgi:GNAT superfamily N-acetyltransferase
MYLAYREGQPVATFALRSSDEEAWGQQPPDAFYVHHLGVRRSQNGKGVGRRLLAWSADFSRTNGKSFLRLDCIASNQFLQDYYTRAGFLHVGYHYLPHDRGMICLFEKDLAARSDE